jgi:hypothetical protein
VGKNKQRENHIWDGPFYSSTVLGVRSQRNIPFSTENEGMIMVQEEGGDINERDLSTCIELTDYNVHNPKV